MSDLNIDYKYVRPSKASEIDKLRHSFYQKEELTCLLIQNGTILPLKRFTGDGLLFGRGGCVTCEGDYVSLSGIPKRIEGRYDFEAPEYIDRRVVYCGYLIKHWGHFLIEGISRLWYALEHSDEFDEFVFFTISDCNYSLEGNFEDFFDLLGIKEKISIINHPVQYKLIAIPELSYSREEYYSEKYNKLINQVRNKASNRFSNAYKEKEYASKIYLSRSRFVNNSQNKSEFGLEMLDAFFEQNGYEIVYPEEISLSELILRVMHANVCASESGSCAHNLLFANRNAQIEIVERQAYVNEIQANLDVIRGYQVTYIDAYYCFYPCDAAGGPYLLYYTKWLAKFCREKGYLPPDDCFLSDSFKVKAITWYIDYYDRRYGKKLFLCKDVLTYAGVFYEAIEESNLSFASFFPYKKRFVIRARFPRLYSFLRDAYHLFRSAFYASR